ncbi:MAG: TonB-dependent receptor [Akkermansiaceae bacterium]|nr:TonB-dependent receptor [Akkermansiaceae bacterium]MDB4434074.1 TonB-dependent receptor [Akkermansiaceae bacterium]
MKGPLLTADDKALQLNLDPSIYGTFAEIGAGQEVANRFFRASASAGTVAKTISAYDMTISDALYGKTSRYVSQDRLIDMVNYEYELLEERLGEERGDRSKFFSFANTVRARGYQDEEECHGWLGIRCQSRSGGPSGTIVLHTRLLDRENVDQMEALGILGVNLIWAAYKHSKDLSAFVKSLVDFLVPGRIEIDMLKFLGDRFTMVDNRLCALELVRQGLTPATVFMPDGDVVQPAEAFYKTPLLVLRGSFIPVTKLHLDMLEQAGKNFPPEGVSEGARPCREVCEVSLSNLLRDGEIDLVSFIDRVDVLQALGKVVMISNCPEFHRVAATLRLYTREPVGMVLSIGLLNELFKEKWSEKLAGGILESFGRLFKAGVTLLVYPWQNNKDGELVTAENFRAPENLKHLYRHFIASGRISGIDCSDPKLLEMTGRDILRAARDGGDWEEWVPEEARPLVKSHA